MFITTVSPNAIDDRIAAESNAPEFAECALKLAGCGLTLRKLGDIVTAPINNSIRDVAEAYQHRGGTIPLFRPADMEGVWLDADSALRVSCQFEAQHEKARVVPGNIVIAAAGTVARAARVPHGIAYGAINGSCARVVVPVEADGFVLAYLISRHGFLSLMRWAVGSVQKHLNLEDIPRVTVPWPDQIVLRYIGNKVRQAEELRKVSQLSIAWARSTLERLIPTDDTIACSINGKDEKHQRVSSEKLADRIDGWYYKPEFLRIEAALNHVRACGTSLIPVHRIGEVEYGFMPTEDYWARGEGAPLLRVTNIKENLVVDTSDLEYVNPVLSNKPRYRLRTGDVLCVQCGNSTGRIAFVTDKFQGMVFPSFALRVTNIASDWDSAFVACFFASTVGQAQIQRTISITSVRPNTTKPAIEAVEVPKFSSENQKRIGDAVRRGVTLREFVDPLCNAAKFLVEALIEKRIAVCELEAAQKALECGDSSLDREILKRLTVLGIDAPGESPLFPDVDAVYTAIQETKTAETTNGDAP